MQSDDITPLFTQPSLPLPDIGFHQGIITAWNSQTGENEIAVLGTNVPNVPMLNITEALVLRPGHVVGLLRFKTNYFILGRIVVPADDQFFTGVMPGLAYTLWQVNSDAATQTGTSDSNYYPKYVGAYVIGHKSAFFQGRLNLSGNPATTGQWRIQWYTAHPGNGANPAGGTLMFTSTLSNNPLTELGSYDWPAGMLGELVFVSWEVRMTVGVSGTDWAAVVPHYLYGADE